MISGGPIPHFKRGWAIIPFRQTPHYWLPDDTDVIFIVAGERTRQFKALCGVIAATYTGTPPLAMGDFTNDRCRHCRRIAAKRRLT